MCAPVLERLQGLFSYLLIRVSGEQNKNFNSFGESDRQVAARALAPYDRRGCPLAQSIHKSFGNGGSSGSGVLQVGACEVHRLDLAAPAQRL